MLYEITEEMYDARKSYTVASRLCSKANYALKVIADSIHNKKNLSFDLIELEDAVAKLVDIQQSINR